ncbi:MAG: hypothetical protein J6K61_07440 [Clostridia bacterium]|nr:hypothetical protein [Clostridia bacterium]
MENNHQDKIGFSYTYSAKQQEEIKSIRKKYMPREEFAEEDKMELLRRLDAGVTKKATALSLVIGILGALVLGTGMSLAMTELGSFLGSQTVAILVGAGVGLFGIAGVALAFPLYELITKRERQKIAPEILRLTEELMK